MATIVDQLAENIGTSVANLLKGQYSASDLDRLRNSITQTIANALSPPGNGPPGTAAQQADALAARLRSLVETIARDAKRYRAAERNRGKYLGRQLGERTPGPTKRNQRNSEYARCLVGCSFASRFGGCGAVRAVIQRRTSRTPISVARAIEHGGVDPGTTRNAADHESSRNGRAERPARHRSVNTDERPVESSNCKRGWLAAKHLDVECSRPARTNARARRGRRHPGERQRSFCGRRQRGRDRRPALLPSTSALTPTMLAAKFAAMLADVDAGAVSASSSPSNTSTNSNSGHTFGQDLAQQTPSGANLASLIAPPSSNLGSQVQSALQSSGNGSTVDANHIIEQMLSGMTMRTLAQGTSEIRLQLQPENLGQVTMRLTVTETKSVPTSSRRAPTFATRSLPTIRTSRARSPKPDRPFRVLVDVSGGDAGKDQSKDGTAGFGRRYVVHELNGAATADSRANLGSRTLAVERFGTRALQFPRIGGTNGNH